MFDGVFCYPVYSILVIPNVIICDGESTVNVMEGDLMTLHCFYDTNVTPVQFMWLQNNISISYGEGNGNTSIPLQIKRITRSKSGSYICTFMWLQNNISISYGEGNGNTSIPLQIKRITRSKSGSYICTVWNDVASEVMKFVLLLCVSCEYLSTEKLYLSGGTIGV